MTRVYREDRNALTGQTVAVVGYGNQGRSWALNLRDSGLDPRVYVRADASRDQARADGFATIDIAAASHADVVCVLVPDDAIPSLPIERRTDSLTVVEAGIIEAILTELFLSGEVERTYRLVRQVGFAKQLTFHSPTSQYGQLSRRGVFDYLDFAPRMRELIDDFASGRVADEWDAEMQAGVPRLQALKEQHAGAFVQAFEDDLRARLGPLKGQE